MQKIIKFAVLFTLLLGFVSVSCSKNPENPETLPAPSGLRVGTLTATTAALSWTEVDGAEGYNVVINEEALVMVTAASHTATGLIAETPYTWMVQAVRGDMVSEWAYGEGFTTPATSTVSVPAPTNLAVTDVAATGVTLSWQHPDADKHEVVLNDGTPREITGLGCIVTGLTAETAYTWKVRSGKDGVWSEWAQGDGFTTGPRTKVIPVHSQYWGTYYGYANAVTFSLGFYDEQLNSSGRNGIQVLIEMVVSTADIDMGTTVEILDIPNGKYTVSVDPATTGAYMIFGSNSYVARVVNGSGTSQAYVSGGSVTISGDHTDYTMTLDLSCEDGSKFAGEYSGPFDLSNPYYIPPAGEPINFGTLTSMLAMDYKNKYGSGSIDSFLTIAGDPGTTLAGGQFGGTGWVFASQIHTPLNSGKPMPDGEYNIDLSYAPRTATAWNGSAGTRLFRMEGGNRVELYGLVSGKITSTYSGGVYTMQIAGQDISGTQISGTIQATAP